MTTDTNQPASADIEPKPTQSLEKPTEEVTTPASEEPEKWDEARAMATIKAQRAEAKELKAQLKDYERLKAEEQKRIEAQMSEAEKLQKRADELAAQNAKLQSDLLRRDVIAETGLPAELAERLKGTTKEELLADAEALKKILPKQNNPHISATNPSGASTTETDAQKRERLFGKPVNIFDPEYIKKSGGGVIFNK